MKDQRVNVIIFCPFSSYILIESCIVGTPPPFLLFSSFVFPFPFLEASIVYLMGYVHRMYQRNMKSLMMQFYHSEFMGYVHGMYQKYYVIHAVIYQKKKLLWFAVHELIIVMGFNASMS